ncbi:molluscan insulin-related peptide 7-like isoform X2 [Pomacea canaliculata]|nr:molluscan insulin-related peptide 7-like isoform X2 [Pomacea canaliculata]
MAMTEAMSLCMALVLCMLGQASGSEHMMCGVDARPHPRGLCGDYLMRARQNLCALLRKDYPEQFGKRSVDQLLQFPLKSFANMDFFTEEGPVKSASDYSKMLLPVLPKASDSPVAEDMGEYDLDLERQKRQGMVCDCCYNQCRPSQLARYC